MSLRFKSLRDTPSLSVTDAHRILRPYLVILSGRTSQWHSGKTWACDWKEAQAHTQGNTSQSWSLSRRLLGSCGICNMPQHGDHTNLTTSVRTWHNQAIECEKKKKRKEKTPKPRHFYVLGQSSVSVVCPGTSGQTPIKTSAQTME